MRNKSSGADPVEVILLLIGLAALFLLWPALALHGRTPEGAWHWTLGCTIGCAVWWGFLLTVVISVILAKANSPQIRERERLESPGVPGSLT